MLGRCFKICPFCVPFALIVVLTSFGFAQQPIPLYAPGQQPPDPQPQPLPLPNQPQPAQPAPGDGNEVLTTGPVHEAFATTAENPTPSPVVPNQPPDPVEELPPDQKPDGDNVQWIPGYWHWDDESSRFIWISGFWRQVPPGRVWVPGSWRQVTGGWQWVSGFWQDTPANPQQNQQIQPELQYLPQPPDSLEVGPAVPAPNTTSIYAPGAWIWQGKYMWRPGVWVDYRPNWIWVPARYYWTPAGYVFVEGYWDYPLMTRGVLFSPMAFPQSAYTQPGFSYTPSYVLSEPAMIGALFVRSGRPFYYFGNYFANQFASRGFRPWCGSYGRNGFTLGYGVGRNWGYDPLWSYYSVAYRNTPEWHRGVSDVYHGRYSGELQRPPVTLVQQNRTINTITKTSVNNITNNIIVKNGRPMINNTDVSGLAMVAPLKLAPQIQQVKFQKINEATRRNDLAVAKQIRQVAVQRTQAEMRLTAQPMGRPAPGKTVQPRSIKLDVPKTVAAASQIRNEKLAPPPNPHQANTGGTRIEPPHGPATQPKPQPQVKPNPKVEPTPKVEPKPNPVTTPKVEPKPNPIPTPKVEPKPTPVPNPKVEPKPNPKVNPVPTPKVEPKPNPAPTPKVEPKSPSPKVNPQPLHPTAPSTPAPQHPRPPTVVHPTAPPVPHAPLPAPHERPQPKPPQPPAQPPKAKPPAPTPQPRPAAPAQPPRPAAPAQPPHPAAPAQPPHNPAPQPRPAAPKPPPHPPAPAKPPHHEEANPKPHR